MLADVQDVAIETLSELEWRVLTALKREFAVAEIVPAIWDARAAEAAVSLPEFLRRFCLHLLPERFVKIRHYGLLANRGRAQRLAQIKSALKPAPAAAVEPSDSGPTTPPSAHAPAEHDAPDARRICPRCGQRALVWVETVYGPARGPPTPDLFAA